MIVSFIKRVDDPGAKSEATRVLTNLIKTIWVEKNNNALRSKLLETSTIEPIIELICTSQFPILKNDGIMALTLVFSDKENSSNIVQGELKYHILVVCLCVSNIPYSNLTPHSKYL